MKTRSLARLFLVSLLTLSATPHASAQATSPSMSVQVLEKDGSGSFVLREPVAGDYLANRPLYFEAQGAGVGLPFFGFYIRYLWNFGDGSVLGLNAYRPNQFHTYTWVPPQGFTATVDVFDDDGNPTELQQHIPINGTHPVPQVSIAIPGEQPVLPGVYHVDSGDTVSFEASAVTYAGTSNDVHMGFPIYFPDNPTRVSWLWNFGDGSTPGLKVYMKEPAHQYVYEAGADNVYQVNLTAFDDRGASGLASAQIEVQPIGGEEFQGADCAALDPGFNKIYTTAELRAFLSGSQGFFEVDDKTVLCSDLDFAAEAAIVRSNEPVFYGEFHGGNYTISNLVIQGFGYNTGLFARVGNYGQVHYLTLRDVDILGLSDTGAIAGILEGEVDAVRLENVGVDGTTNVGGVAGRAAGARISRVFVVNDATHSIEGGGGTGGLVGRISDPSTRATRISQSAVYSDASAYAKLGGLVGSIETHVLAFDPARIEESKYVGSLHGQFETFHVGGLVGSVSNDGPPAAAAAIRDSYAIGNITLESMEDVNAGFAGLVGTRPVDSSLDHSYAAVRFEVLNPPILPGRVNGAAPFVDPSERNLYDPLRIPVELEPGDTAFASNDFENTASYQAAGFNIVAIDPPPGTAPETGWCAYAASPTPLLCWEDPADSIPRNAALYD